jgi:hypothetical protein
MPCNTPWKPGKFMQNFMLRKGKRPLGRFMCGWEDNVMDLKEMELKGVGWIDVGEGGEKWESVIYNVMNLWLT